LWRALARHAHAQSQHYAQAAPGSERSSPFGLREATAQPVNISRRTAAWPMVGDSRATAQTGDPVDLFEFLTKRSGDMPELGLGPAAVVGISVLLASVIGVALGVLTYQRQRPRELVLAATGAMLTVPSFALFIILLGVFGLGWLPVVVALTMYGLMPI